MSRTPRKSRSVLLAVVAATLISAGCRRPSVYIDRYFDNPYDEPKIFAVAPFLNQSGSENLDSIAVTDEFFTELQQVRGLSVVPVNRVLAVMSELGMQEGVNSPEEAVNLANALQVDGIIVGSITRYDPYFPPLVGMAIQLYTKPEKDSEQDQNIDFVDPGALARQGKPFVMNPGARLEPSATVVRIYDAQQDDVVIRLKDFSRSRRLQNTPLDWKKYTTSRNYISFTCHEMIGELLAKERRRLHSDEEEAW